MSIKLKLVAATPGPPTLNPVSPDGAPIGAAGPVAQPPHRRPHAATAVPHFATDPRGGLSRRRHPANGRPLGHICENEVTQHLIMHVMTNVPYGMLSTTCCPSHKAAGAGPVGVIPPLYACFSRAAQPLSSSKRAVAPAFPLIPPRIPSRGPAQDGNSEKGGRDGR